MQILNDSEARFNSADLNIAYKMNVDEYQRLCPYSQSLEANWGKAPGIGCAVLWHQKFMLQQHFDHDVRCSSMRPASTHSSEMLLGAEAQLPYSCQLENAKQASDAKFLHVTTAQSVEAQIPAHAAHHTFTLSVTVASDVARQY